MTPCRGPAEWRDLRHRIESYHRRMHIPFALALAAALAAPWAAQAQSAWLFGEQHDQRDHQHQTAEAVAQLAHEGRLHAVVLEMSERGLSTRGLPRDASEAEAQSALNWDGRGWPWANYRDVVMNAVRAGVPVMGGNLPRDKLRDAMKQPRWDNAVPATARERLTEAVREGHCGMVPDEQLPSMVRMQIARDRSLAETLAEASRGAVPSDVVLMLSGSAHASRLTGVPLHVATIAPQLAVRSIAFTQEGADEPSPQGFDERRVARADPSPDHCAELRERGMPSMSGAAPTSSAASSPAPIPSTP